MTGPTPPREIPPIWSATWIARAAIVTASERLICVDGR